MHQIKNDSPHKTASGRPATTAIKTTKNGEVNQIRYTAKEREIILSIAEELRTVEKAGDKIGKLVDELVVNNGGIKYGDETIARIAAYPDINCSAQHLRRCWNLYRFNSGYGLMVSAEHKKVCRAARYQIARLLDLEMDVKAMLAIVDECVHQTVTRRLTVDEVREMVSRRLDEFGKSRKKSTKKTPRPQPVEVKNEVASGSDLKEFADRLSLMADPDKFSAALMSSSEIRLGLVRLLSETIATLRRLADSGPNEDLGAAMMKKGNELKEIGKRLLESGAPHDEVA